MSILLPQLRTNLRNQLGLEEFELPNSDADELLNRSLWAVMPRFNFREKEKFGVFSTVAGTRQYSIPTSFDGLRHLSVLEPNSEQHIPLKYMDVNEYETVYSEQTSLQAIPTHYVREANCIRLWPTPDIIYSITIRWWITLADLSDDNTLTGLPQNWDEIVLYGALWRGYGEKNNDWSRATVAQNFQDKLINEVVPIESKEKINTKYAALQPWRPPYNVRDHCGFDPRGNPSRNFDLS